MMQTERTLALRKPAHFMPTFIGTTREFNILIDALSDLSGVTRANRPEAIRLRERLKMLMSYQEPPKSIGHIRASWPTGFLKPEKKQNNWFHKPREKKEKVELNNSKTQEKINDVLKGLI